MSERQEILDTFYFSNGPCCAGCDWWQSINSLVGACTQAAIVPGKERASMLGIDRPSLDYKAGHPFTERGHHCGQFKDDFDWTTLPIPYRKRIGAPATR